MRQRMFTLFACILIALGSIASIVGFCANIILGLDQVWLWGFAMLGWSLATASMGDLLRAAQIINKEDKE